MRPLARPLLCTVLLVAALVLAACGGDDGGSGGGATGSTPTAPTTSTTPAGELDGALWPDPAGATDEATPAQVARSFVEDFVGMPRPALGDFQPGDSRSGEIPMYLVGEDGRPRADRVLTTIALRQLDGRRWFVIAAISEQIAIDAPQTAGVISSPVTIEGKGAGFESNLVASVHAAFERKPLAEKPVGAGQTQPEPYSASLSFERPAAATGAIVVRDSGALDGVATAFSALPVRFAAAG
jgi:hypothetical protein